MKGFTVIEVLVSTFLCALAAVFIATVWTNSVRLNQTLELQADAEKERWSAEAQVRAAFLQAVDLTYVGNRDLANWQGEPGQFTGALRSFDSDAHWATAAQTTYPLAIFYRDEARSPVGGNATGLKSKFVRTGLYFQKPTYQKWGALYLDLADVGGGPVDPRKGIIFEGLIRVQIKGPTVRTFNPFGTANPGAYDPPGPVSPKPVTSFDLEMTFRKYIASQTNEPLVFCPSSWININTQCMTKTPYHDIVRTLRIVVRNNVLSISPTAPITGPPVGVQFGSRIYDRIHFFKPTFTKGLL
jgi:type II secretory pathway pseudopilin PulG